MKEIRGQFVFGERILEIEWRLPISLKKRGKLAASLLAVKIIMKPNGADTFFEK